MLLVLPAALFYALVYLYPLGRLGAWSVLDPAPGLANYARIAGDAVYAQALVNTLEISLWTTLAALILGYPLAYLMTTVSQRVRAWLTALVMVPFWTSILVRSFAWVVILGTNGIVNKALVGLGIVERPVRLLYNLLGVEIGMVHVLLPFMVFPLYAAMTQIDAGLLAAGRSLGAAPWRGFLHIFLPLSLPGVAAGCVLVFLMAIGFYITPALLGGPQQITLATLIEMQFSDLMNWGFAAALSVALVGVTAALFLVFGAVLGTERLTGAR